MSDSRKSASRRFGRVVLSAVALAAPLAACATNLGEPASSEQAKVSRVQPTTAPQNYVLAPGDNVEVRFTWVPDLNQAQVIRPDGKIALPLVHDVPAAGMTPSQLQDALLKDYKATALKDPELVVIVREYNSNKIYVGGEVVHPGTQPILTPTTVLQAIMEANGFKDTARYDEVMLIRERAGGGYDWQVLNLEKALKGVDFSEDIPLAPRDVVYVPRSDIANVGEWVELYIRRLLPIAPGFSVAP